MTGYGQDGAQAPSSLLAEPSRLLRQTVESWVLQLEGIPAGEDFEGVSEALVIALECGGYPVTDLFSGHVELAYVGHAGDPLDGDNPLRKIIEAQRFIIKTKDDEIRKIQRENIDLRSKTNRAEMLVKLQQCGVIS